MYMTQVVCEKCGQEMSCTDTLCSYPAQYCYSCDRCGTSFCTTTKSGTIEYEFEEDKDAYFNKLQNQAVAQVKNKKGCRINENFELYTMYNFITQGSYFLGFKKKPPMRKPKPVAFS